MKEFTYFVKFIVGSSKDYASFTVYDTPMQTKHVVGKVAFDLQNQGLKLTKICKISCLEQDFPDPIMKTE